MKVIRLYRQQAGMTMEELAKASGVNFTTIGYAERGGSHRLNVSTLEKISKVLGISASELLFAEEILARKQKIEKTVEEFALTGW